VTRVLDWMHYLGVAVAVEDVQLGVTVAVEDLRPKAKYVQTTLAAVKDIRLCEKIFNNWMTELDKAVNSSEKPDEREVELRFYLELLKAYAGHCSNEANKILRCHVRFASLVAQRMDNASKSQYNLKYDGSETTRLAEDISDASDSLSTYVALMKDILDKFVSVLEEVQVTVKKEPSLGERILGWLKYLFQAIARILATVCSSIFTFTSSPEPNKQIPVSTLEQGVATFCTVGPEPQEGKESESLDSVILLLKKIVPREAQTAQKNLKQFDAALDIMGLDHHMKEGRRVTLCGSDPAAVAKKWRRVVEQYQSVLPDDINPA
jgi:hypothetical protein